MFKLTTFDVTGTLLRFKSGVGQQYSETLQKVANLICDPQTIEKSFATAYKSHIKVYPCFGKTEAISAKIWWRSVFYQTLFISGFINKHGDAILSKINLPSNQLKSNQDLKIIENAFESVYKNFAYETVPHAHELLKYLRKDSSNVIGVITNSDDRVRSELKRADLINYFDFIVTSTECGCDKPGEQIFNCALTMAAEHLKQKAPFCASSSLHIGDNLDEDYYGATKAGFSALMLDPHNKYSKIIDPQHCIKDLGNALHFLNKDCL